MTTPPELFARYGVEIKSPTLHVECEKLEQVLTLLEGHTGVVRVFDRFTRELVVDDTAHAARQSLGEIAGRRCATTPLAGHGPTVAKPIEDDATISRAVPAQGAQADDVQISGGLSIATAYYVGDLSTITRKRDRDGEDMYIRSMFTRLRP